MALPQPKGFCLSVHPKARSLAFELFDSFVTRRKGNLNNPSPLPPLAPARSFPSYAKNNSVGPPYSTTRQKKRFFMPLVMQTDTY